LDSPTRLKVESIKVHLAAIKAWHVDGEWPDPTDSIHIKKKLKKYQSLERQNNIFKEASRFITPEEAFNLVVVMLGMNKSKADQRNRLMTSIALMSGFRAGMVARIKIDHLLNLGVPGSPILIETPAFKTAADDTTYIPFTGSKYCPATWIREYVRDNDMAGGYLFKSLKKDSGKSLSRNTINTELKKVLSAAGTQGGKLTSHSFRKTMAMLAALEGVNAVDIAAQGSWESIETVNKDYVSKSVALQGKAPIAVLASIEKAGAKLGLLNDLDSDSEMVKIKDENVKLSYAECVDLHRRLSQIIESNKLLLGCEG
jgi:integrase